jgi:hypothetical protein
VPRYVILEHTGTPEYKPGVHWDLMLEVGERLQTWELASIPSSGATVPALPLADHRLEYLDYEGPISGNRGTVRQWDRGTYTGPDQPSSDIILDVRGDILRGQLKLARESMERSGWKLSFVPG